ncbi:MAG: hypothetical protein KDD60_11160 [Bdellovibrionales bacterium]|nr:hypothetical protein [Bdellovibrionales bacterium]
MRSTVRYLLALLLFAASVQLLATPRPLSAEELTKRYPSNTLIGDGKEGRVWNQLRQSVQEHMISRVEVELLRKKGSNDTFVNLRFGNGDTFENGRKIFLSDDQLQTVVWTVGSAPLGQPLVLNAYKGEVLVKAIRVYFGSPGGTPYVSNTQEDPKRTFSWRDAAANVTDGDEPKGKCARAFRVKPPRLEITSIEATGGLFSGKYAVKGTAHGACVEGAGYFEHGKLRQKITFPESDSYDHVEFSVATKTGENGEIRVYTTSGEEDIKYIDEIVAHEQSQYHQ